MKTKVILLGIAMLAVSMNACHKGTVGEDAAAASDDLAMESTVLLDSVYSADKSWQPLGSSFQTVNRELLITPPQGWGYVGYDINDNLVNVQTTAGKKISCTCTGSGNCNPFVADGLGGSTSGCAGNCTSCTQTQSVFMQNQYLGVISGGYYNPNATTRLLQDGEQAAAVFDALFELNDFRTELEDFYTAAYGTAPVQAPVIAPDGTASAPQGHSLVAVSIFGRGMVAIVPDSYAQAHLGFSLASAKASCSCTSGTCTLKTRTIVIGSATYCEGNCSGTCTLNTNSLAPFQAYNVAINSYTY